MGKELFEESVVAIETVVASSKEGGVQGGSLADVHNKPRNIKRDVKKKQNGFPLTKSDIIKLNISMCACTIGSLNLC